MPYSKPLVPDRKAVAQVSYQLRRFAKQLKEMDIPEPFKNAFIEDLYLFEERVKGANIDYDDDGSILKGSANNDSLLGEGLDDLSCSPRLCGIEVQSAILDLPAPRDVYRLKFCIALAQKLNVVLDQKEED